MGILQAGILKQVAMPSSGDLPNPGIKPRSPSLQADSLSSEPPGEPFNLNGALTRDFSLEGYSFSSVK